MSSTGVQWATTLGACAGMIHPSQQAGMEPIFGPIDRDVCDAIPAAFQSSIEAPAIPATPGRPVEAHMLSMPATDFASAPRFTNALSLVSGNGSRASAAAYLGGANAAGALAFAGMQPMGPHLSRSQHSYSTNEILFLLTPMALLFSGIGIWFAARAGLRKYREIQQARAAAEPQPLEPQETALERVTRGAGVASFRSVARTESPRNFDSMYPAKNADNKADEKDQPKPSVHRMI